MQFSIGIDIGGTKIAGAVFDASGHELSRTVLPTPRDYAELVETCVTIVKQLDETGSARATLGVGVPGAVAAKVERLPTIANIPCLSGQKLHHDLEHRLKRSVRLANDADCAALSEATDGAGAGFRTVFGLVMGTGVGGGFVVEGKLVQGANGLAGEIGHLPLPFREPSDGPVLPCVCGQSGCIDKSASGPALVRLYNILTGKKAETSPQIAELARGGDDGALEALDRFYTTVAKAMVPVMHTYDPDVIVVCGGLTVLPGMYETVPARIGQYTLMPDIITRFVPAKHGALTGLRGAAWVGRV